MRTHLLDTATIQSHPRVVAFGLSNEEISRSLEISVETVKEHVANILRKLAVKDRTHAAVRALQTGLA